MTRSHSKLNQAKYIRLAERDNNVGANDAGWPAADAAPNGWAVVSPAATHGGWLERTIQLPHPTDGSGSGSRSGDVLYEAVGRFPTAPIYGINRVHDHPVNLPTARFHTYRMLALGEDRPTSVDRIFLFNNGLNELEQIELYYTLAFDILQNSPSSVCILRPFPGHLSRFPFPAMFAQKPLDEYLFDSSNLYRQYLRYMIETRWFLSAVAPRSQYNISSGADLLLSSPDPATSRLSTHLLARAIDAELDSMHEASQSQVQAATDSTAEDASKNIGDTASARTVESAIQALRTLLCIPTEPAEPATPDAPNGETEARTIHVVGYSLGGFVAQATFMTWPFAISSCSTICSGGPLRDLSLTAFAHPEEWQTVMNSLRYQLDEAMLEGRISRDDQGRTAGIEQGLFEYLSRIFYEIFEQEHRASYQTQIREYARRLLFVVGGNDPIVRPQAVLDSAPKDGFNLLSIARLTHFLGSRASDPVEGQQREYWIPEVAGILARFAREAERAHAADIQAGWLTDDLTQLAHPLLTKPLDTVNLALNRFGPLDDGALATPDFERALDDLCDRMQAGDGWLFLARNDVPTALLEPRLVGWYASALHHADRPIVRYIKGIEERASKLAVSANWTAVLPHNVQQRFLSGAPGFPPNSDAPIGQLSTAVDADDAWERFSDRWLGNFSRVRFFTAGTLEPGEAAIARSYTDTLLGALKEKNRYPVVVNALPDCWLWVSRDWLELPETPKLPTVLERLIGMRATFALDDPKNALQGAMERNQLRVITTSGARFNPRYRGKVVTNVRELERYLLHVALVAAYSTPT